MPGCQDGLVADWNSKNDPFKHICAGDFIFQASGWLSQCWQGRLIGSAGLLPGCSSAAIDFFIIWQHYEVSDWKSPYGAHSPVSHGVRWIASLETPWLWSRTHLVRPISWVIFLWRKSMVGSKRSKRPGVEVQDRAHHPHPEKVGRWDPWNLQVVKSSVCVNRLDFQAVNFSSSIIQHHKKQIKNHDNNNNHHHNHNSRPPLPHHYHDNNNNNSNHHHHEP